MDETQKNKIQQFINDDMMFKVILEFLTNSFLNRRGQRDIQIMAAERMAIELLDDGFRELEKFKFGGEEEKVEKRQVGL